MNEIEKFMNELIDLIIVTNNELIQGYVALIKEDLAKEYEQFGYSDHKGKYKDHIKLLEKYSNKSWEELKG